MTHARRRHIAAISSKDRAYQPQVNADLWKWAVFDGSALTLRAGSGAHTISRITNPGQHRVTWDAPFDTDKYSCLIVPSDDSTAAMIAYESGDGSLRTRGDFAFWTYNRGGSVARNCADIMVLARGGTSVAGATGTDVIHWGVFNTSTLALKAGDAAHTLASPSTGRYDITFAGTPFASANSFACHVTPNDDNVASRICYQRGNGANKTASSYSCQVFSVNASAAQAASEIMFIAVGKG